MPIEHPETFNDFTNLIKENKVCMVDFFATWCGPCKVLGESLKNKYQNDPSLRIIKVDIDNEEFTNLSEVCKVSALPFVVFFVNGVIQSEQVVGNNLKQIVAYVDKFTKAD